MVLDGEPLICMPPPEMCIFGLLRLPRLLSVH